MKIEDFDFGRVVWNPDSDNWDPTDFVYLKNDKTWYDIDLIEQGYPFFNFYFMGTSASSPIEEILGKYLIGIHEKQEKRDIIVDAFLKKYNAKTRKELTEDQHKLLKKQHNKFDLISEPVILEDGTVSEDEFYLTITKDDVKIKRYRIEIKHMLIAHRNSKNSAKPIPARAFCRQGRTLDEVVKLTHNISNQQTKPDNFDILLSVLVYPDQLEIYATDKVTKDQLTNHHSETDTDKDGKRKEGHFTFKYVAEYYTKHNYIPITITSRNQENIQPLLDKNGKLIRTTSPTLKIATTNK